MDARGPFGQSEEAVLWRERLNDDPEVRELLPSVESYVLNEYGD